MWENFSWHGADSTTWVLYSMHCIGTLTETHPPQNIKSEYSVAKTNQSLFVNHKKSIVGQANLFHLQVLWYSLYKILRYRRQRAKELSSSKVIPVTSTHSLLDISISPTYLEVSEYLEVHEYLLSMKHLPQLSFAFSVRCSLILLHRNSGCFTWHDVKTLTWRDDFPMFQTILYEMLFSKTKLFLTN